MDRSEDRRLEEFLPPRLVSVLRLRDSGASEEDIAVALDTPVESVQPLIGLAEAKLATLRQRFPDPHPEPP